MKIDQVRQIHDELSKTEFGSKVGAIAMTILSIGASAIPLVGGPVSTSIDKLKSKIYDPDYADYLERLSSALIALEPMLASVDSFEERVSALEGIAGADTASAKILGDILEDLANRSIAQVDLVSIGGATEFKNNVVRNMHLNSIARDGGRADVANVHVHGSAKFESGPAGVHSITGSVFTAERDGFRGLARYKSGKVESGTTVEMMPRDVNVAQRITVRAGLHDDVAAVSVQNGRLVFGAKRNSGDGDR